MHLAPDVFDIWGFRRRLPDVEFLLLHASEVKAARHFNGGRFWQIPSGATGEGESLLQGIDRTLSRFGLTATTIWAAEHAYLIYNRRFEEM